MKSIQKIASREKAIPIAADEITELHAARLLLLLNLCGAKGKISGLTKLAKLDFFCRYPDFFERATAALGNGATPVTDFKESPMIRHNYGPWDHRYYQLLPYLEARGLISVTQQGNTYTFALTPKGKEVSEALSGELPFRKLCNHLLQVKAVFGSLTGSKLKQLIYRLFPEEIEKLPMGKVIE
jgi:hypothetical protein